MTGRLGNGEFGCSFDFAFKSFTFANWQFLLLLCYVPHSPILGPVFFVPCTVWYTVCAESLPVNPRGKRSHREKHQKNREPGFEMTAVASAGHRGAWCAGLGLVQQSGRAHASPAAGCLAPLAGPTGHSGGF